MFLRYFYYFKSLEIRLILVLISFNLFSNDLIEAKHRIKRWDYREVNHFFLKYFFKTIFNYLCFQTKTILLKMF